MHHSLRALAGLFVMVASALAHASQASVERRMREAFTGREAFLQNHTIDTFLSGTVLRHKGEYREYVVYDAEGNDVSARLEFVGEQVVEDDHVTDHFRLRGARPDSVYYLEIRGPYDHVLDTRAMPTLPTKKASPRIAVASCSRTGLLTNEYFGISNWDRMTKLKPDVILFLGDITYADSVLDVIRGTKPPFKKIQKAFVAAWKKDKIYHQFRTVPVFPIWDDHDFGYDNADADNPHKGKVLALYRKFYPLPESGTTSMNRGPGASYAFKAMGHRFVMLDSRFFASYKKRSTGDPTWGSEQRVWLRSQLTGEPAIIANGFLWMRAADGTLRGSIETLSPEEFKDFTDMIRKSATRTLLLAGDTHYSEILRTNEGMFGYGTYQITSSHLHSFAPVITPPFRSGRADGNPDQVFHTGRSNFVLVQPNSYSLDSVKVGIYARNREPSYFNLEIGTPPQRTCDSLFGF